MGKGKKNGDRREGRGAEEMFKGNNESERRKREGYEDGKEGKKGQRERGGGEKGSSPLYSFLKVGAYDAYEFCRYCRAETYLSHPESGHRAGT